MLMGKYDKALDYYNKAEISNNRKEQYFKDLADIYINKAIIYGYSKIIYFSN